MDALADDADRPSSARHQIKEQIQRLSNSLSDPDTGLDLKRLDDVLAGQGASWLPDGPRLPSRRQRQVRLSKGDQRALVAAYLASDTVRSPASVTSSTVEQ